MRLRARLLLPALLDSVGSGYASLADWMQAPRHSDSGSFVPPRDPVLSP